MGLETEYVMRFRPWDAAAERPTNRYLFERLTAALKRLVPTATARGHKEGLFTACGGAVWFEQLTVAAYAGLVEGSTPECRSARQLLVYQRAQDRLLAEACRTADVPGELTLVKNNRDSRGNFHGAHENYEVSLGGPLALAGWRLGLILLAPLLLVTWLATVATVVLSIVALLAAFGVWVVGHLVTTPRQREWIRQSAVGRLFPKKSASETGLTSPAWEAFYVWLVRIICFPAVAGLFCVAWLFAFRGIRRQLTPLLISRAVVGGAGTLGDDGRFELAEKAACINCLTGFNRMYGDRPIYSFGHFLKPLLFRGFFLPREYFGLFSARQRLQICLGDSNMADEAEYLRFGTTLVVLDAIAAGALPRVPRLRRPLRALRQFSADPSLKATARVPGGRQWTALDWQRFYLDGCRRFVEMSTERGAASDEARTIVRRWEQVLDALDREPQSLVGRIDWITKRFLMAQAGNDAMARKKIDLKYHDLSKDGYFNQLCSTELVEPLVDPAELERAMRTAPSGTPAAARGRYIREFTGEGQTVSASWDAIFVGDGLWPKRIELRR
jgi:hypothetical protein